MAFTGSTVFVANYGSSAITACTVAANGTFSGCAQAGTTAASANGGIVLNGNYAYIDNNNGTIYQCTASGQTISGCTAISTGTTGLRSMYLSNNVLYAPSFQGTLLAFAVGSGGSLTKLNSVSLTAPEAVWPAP
jgi:6-phosphogluconolactonase (cycloisomerase 2 family)